MIKPDVKREESQLMNGARMRCTEKSQCGW